MTTKRPSLDDFKDDIATMFGQALTAPASEAVEDFWKNWFLFETAISQRSLMVHVDALILSQVFPEYNRYHVWKGIGTIIFLVGIILVWFIWKTGAIFIAIGVILHIWGGHIKDNDAESFAKNLMEEATLNPHDGGLVKICGNYIAGTIKLVTLNGSAIWPQLPSNAVTGGQSFVQLKSAYH